MKGALSVNTEKAYRQALENFAEYLTSQGIETGLENLVGDPEAWRSITGHLVEGYREWLLAKGYSPGTINVRLTGVRRTANEAFDAGIVSKEEWAMIRLVEGVPAERKRGPKRLSRQQVDDLLDYPDRRTPQGRRDRVMLRLLCRLGMRRSETIALRVEDVSLASDTVTVRREKTHIIDEMGLRIYDLREELQSYLHDLETDAGPLLRSSLRGGQLCGRGMTGEAIYQRVRKIGAAVHLDGLRPHDLRHYLRTSLEEQGLPESEIMKAMGHRTLEGSRRYGYGTGNDWSNIAVVQAVGQGGR